jgi:predicted ATPase/class 3 adenylate cyclase
VTTEAGGGLPTGIVTFLFTDIEGSTRLLSEIGEQYADVLAEHRRMLREAFVSHDGVEVDTQGDALFYAFGSASEAVAAAGEAQVALDKGPVCVRMGIHTGEPSLTEEGYVGMDVHRAARICAAAHGGQVLFSEPTRLLLDQGLGMTDLGLHRLKDLGEPVKLFQLGEAGFPPLRTLNATNLPAQPGPLIGRERELGEVLELLRDGARALTLTGPGGTGKTRLALQAAAELVDDFKDGVFLVPLAAIRDPELVVPTAERVVGARVPLAEHIDERRMLLLVDNLEQVVGAGPALADVLSLCPNLRLLVTSRVLMRVTPEREYSVAPLPDEEAVELFRERAAVAEPIEAVREICQRLDGLPLAVELAAARTRVLPPDRLLKRLGRRLPLLTGGKRDAPARQRTLRATIEWSYDLLSEQESRLFAELSVFAGSFSVEAAEDVCGADIDTLQALVEQSLVRRWGSGRLGMLETIHEFASEKLAASAGADDVLARHGVYFRELAKEQAAKLGVGEPEEGPTSVLAADIENLRAAVVYGLDSGNVDLAREVTASLSMYWMMRGLFREARTWLDRALALGSDDEIQRRLLSALGSIAYGQGDYATAIEASDKAAELAMSLGGATDRYQVVKEQARAAHLRGEYEAAERLWQDAFEVAREVDNGVGMSACRLNLASLLTKADQCERAEGLLAENLPFVRARGQARCEAYTLAAFADAAIRRGRVADAAEHALSAAGCASLIDDQPLVAYCLDLTTTAAAARGDVARAAIILGATEAAREAMGVVPDEEEEAARNRTLELLGQDKAVEGALARGRELDLPSALALAESGEG